ncbi:Trypsin-like peptidase domain-containing protein [Micromonospora pattaloongensis]|uniref:Trypsin-like peptidase domain-containing protein n=1 Tax=Micromonospora pattaloongensis TaxID=405436 RepID=A0A1H3H294_9ACTN|nr:serine protease [Micromonospora pattaloongensis]SDY09571.1 Trypsin-like peptidase domain-containing protein [Micromonospora pattaloongensis]
MRRAIAVVVGACAVVALVDVAGAAIRPTEAENLAPVFSRHQVAAPERTTEAMVRPAALPSSRAEADPAPSAPTDPPRRIRVGAVESVERAIGYAGGERSTVFRYPGARYVKVHFNRLLLLPGDHVTVADPTGAEVHRIDGDPVRGVAELADTAVRGAPLARWAMSVSGDTAVVTLHRARPELPVLGAALARLGVGIDKVARGLTDAERDRASEPAGPGREESVCGGDDAVDAVCYRSAHPVAYQRSRAVARILINGTEFCTAWRIGDQNRMLTNNHCLSSAADAADTEVWFDHRCVVCGGDDVTRATKVWGHRVLSTDRDLDYTLFTVGDFAAVRPYGYLELDPRRPARGEELYIPQHPGGDPMVIAMGSDRDRSGICAVRDPAYDGYRRGSDVSYLCDTAGGSSGSPVISRVTNRVIALHHFGGCPNSGVRVDLIYPRIRHLL